MRERGYKCVKGNHEDMMVQDKGKTRYSGNWTRNGGIQTRRSYDGHTDQMIDDMMELADYFFTVSQAALNLGVSRITIWRWVKEGRLNAQIIGREALIPKWEVDLLNMKTSKTKKVKTY